MFLTRFKTVLVGPVLPQDEIAKTIRGLMEETSGENLEKAFDRYAVGAEYIEQRQVCVIPEGAGGDWAVSVFPESVVEHPRGLDLTERLSLFDDIARSAVDTIFEDTDEAPDDLIHATCTGYLSPSPAQNFAVSRGWFETAVTHSYHMGCYGAFPPVRMATGFLASDPEKHRVDVVHTECCTLHFDITKHDAAHLINTTLFSDGFIGYEVVRDQPKGAALELIASHEVLIPDSASEMSWIPGGNGFDMTLARSVPVKIRDHISPLVSRLCDKAGIEFGPDTILAIHPGGPKILEHIETALGAERSQLQISHDILREHGNMSSATIPHVWQRILDTPSITDGSEVITIAFGPGLTATGLVLKVRRL